MGDFQNKAEDLGGQAKEAFGAATDNDSLENEGKADQAKAGIKDKVSEAGEAVKDTANKVLGSLKGDK